MMNMTTNNRSLDAILRSVRSKADTTFEEQLLMRELLQIIYNRHNFGSHSCLTTFATVFLKQSGLQIDDRLAFEEYNSYRNRKALKYRPHIRISIRSIGVISESLHKIWPNVNINDDNILDLTITTYIHQNQKQKKKFKYNNVILKSGVTLQINSQFIHPLCEKSEELWISISFGRQQNKCRKYFNIFCRSNRIASKAIRLEDLRGIPLTGDYYRCEPIFESQSSEVLLLAQLDISVEFTGDPKHNHKYRAEKLNSHKNLLTKLYNRWRSDTIPSQMKALIEMNRQQNGITSEDSYLLEENVLQELKDLSEANRKRKEFFSLINRAPTPESNDFNNDDNNNSSGLVPPIQDNKVFGILNTKKKIKVRVK